MTLLFNSSQGHHLLGYYFIPHNQTVEAQALRSHCCRLSEHHRDNSSITDIPKQPKTRICSLTVHETGAKESECTRFGLKPGLCIQDLLHNYLKEQEVKAERKE
jgi:hypothetical protein